MEESMRKGDTGWGRCGRQSRELWLQNNSILRSHRRDCAQRGLDLCWRRDSEMGMEIERKDKASGNF